MKRGDRDNVGLLVRASKLKSSDPDNIGLLARASEKLQKAMAETQRKHEALRQAINHEEECRAELLSSVFSRNRLSGRERQIVAMLHQQKCNKEIATALNISVRTAKFHVSNLLRKMRVASRNALLPKISTTVVNE